MVLESRRGLGLNEVVQLVDLDVGGPVGNIAEHLLDGRHQALLAEAVVGLLRLPDVEDPHAAVLPLPRRVHHQPLGWVLLGFDDRVHLVVFVRSSLQVGDYAYWHASLPSGTTEPNLSGVTTLELRAMRAAGQLLQRPPGVGPVEIVRRLLAVQSQDLNQGRRALRARGSGFIAADVDAAIASDAAVLGGGWGRGADGRAAAGAV